MAQPWILTLGIGVRHGAIEIVESPRDRLGPCRSAWFGRWEWTGCTVVCGTNTVGNHIVSYRKTIGVRES